MYGVQCLTLNIMLLLLQPTRTVPESSPTFNFDPPRPWPSLCWRFHPTSTLTVTLLLLRIPPFNFDPPGLWPLPLLPLTHPDRIIQTVTPVSTGDFTLLQLWPTRSSALTHLDCAPHGSWPLPLLEISIPFNCDLPGVQPPSTDIDCGSASAEDPPHSTVSQPYCLCFRWIFQP